jgi:hypothetical protein
LRTLLSCAFCVIWPDFVMAIVRQNSKSKRHSSL